MTLAEELQGVYDIERLLSKVAYKSMNARDCLSLCASLQKVPKIRELLREAKSQAVEEIRDSLDTLPELTDLLTRAIHPDAPILITEGGIIRDGYSQMLDEYRAASTSGKQWILELEQKEREETASATCASSTTACLATTSRSASRITKWCRRATPESRRWRTASAT